MNPAAFIKKWKASTLKERSAAQEHFIDLCRMLGEQTPAEADPDGEWFCFERGASKTGGGEGWADVWRRRCFAWEYKGKHKDLVKAFAQLQRYAITLENPPLLIVSDMDTISVHTNFTNTVQQVHVIAIEEIGNARNLEILKWAFNDPERLRPGVTTEAITERAASQFAQLAEALRQRRHEPQRVAHFLNKLLFCMFAEDAGLLPSRLFIKLLEAGLKHPKHANEMLRQLFGAMTKGEPFGAEIIEWFNGGLFDSDEAIELTAQDMKSVLSVARLDWSAIEPSIFGTLFERGLDPDKRSQLGAHYTDPGSIMRIVQPTVMEPLNSNWNTTKKTIEQALASAAKAKSPSVKTRWRKAAQRALNGFLHRLAEFRVLDPACGSGNFLYLALQSLKDLEHRALLEAEQMGLEAGFVGLNVGVQCVHGIEINSYAAELARVTVWIGDIQWSLRHGEQPARNPILKPLNTIECRDAVLDADGKEAEWPQADAIIGNPPFLGDRKMIGSLGEDYTLTLRRRFEGRLPAGSDLVCYWFEKARDQLARGKASTAGLVATNSIRGGANRVVLERISETAEIHDAWSDEDWVLDGAAVRVSIVNFRPRTGHAAILNGMPVARILPDLSPARNGEDGKDVDLTKVRPLAQNERRSFLGIQKTGPFDISGAVAREWLVAGGNPNGRPNADVVKPWANGLDVVRRPQDMWIVDFGVRMQEGDAALYEKPFQHVLAQVKPLRVVVRRAAHKRNWWLFGDTRPRHAGGNRAPGALHRHARGVKTPCVRVAATSGRSGQEPDRDRQG